MQNHFWLVKMPISLTCYLFFFRLQWSFRLDYFNRRYNIPSMSHVNVTSDAEKRKTDPDQMVKQH